MKRASLFTISIYKYKRAWWEISVSRRTSSSTYIKQEALLLSKVHAQPSIFIIFLLPASQSQPKNMMSKALLFLSVCVTLAALSEGQRPTNTRPFYAPNPWYDGKGPQDQGGSSSSAAPTTTVAPLGDRFNQFLIPVENNVSFKYYNNVPIEGPDAPCIGCVYRLTRNGFVMVRP